MFNGRDVQRAIVELNDSIRRHESIRGTIVRACERLYRLRKRASTEVLDAVSAYADSLENAPAELSGGRDSLWNQVAAFDSIERSVQSTISRNAGSSVIEVSSALVAAVGAGVATFGQPAALAVATTFGTASTGTSISVLAGAPATNAALAWLGGGALAAGGGGMAAGKALLALAGPVGWSISGAALLGGGLLRGHSNRRKAANVQKERAEVESRILVLLDREIRVRELGDAILGHCDACLAGLSWLREHAPSSYDDLDAAQKERLDSVIEHTRTLGELVTSGVAP